MVVRRKKKSRKFRGGSSHGWGAHKKHRGSGHRGGVGRAGVGKRGAQKKTAWLTAHIPPIGKVGMRRRVPKKFKKTINLHTLDQQLEQWLATGEVKKEKDFFLINLEKLGYTKLLAAGKITQKMKIRVPKWSEPAKKKLEAAGSSIVQK